MSEVKRYDCTNGKAQHCYGCYEMTETNLGDYVKSEDFDRVTAERDALQVSLNAVTFNLDKTDKVALALQQRMTEADEENYALKGIVGEILDAVGREPLDLDAVLRLRSRMRAALKPSEANTQHRQECTSCNGNGLRVMGCELTECPACDGEGYKP